MEWVDEGIILGVRRHGETNAILEVLTERKGRHAGLVRGGRSQRMRAVLQAGNAVNLTWRARLEDHLGTFSVEAKSLRAATTMTTSSGLHALNALTSLCLLLSEREPHPRLYRALSVILEDFGSPEEAAYLVLRFELAFLDELGFGLDLTSCAATETTKNLIFVSPKSARAVCAEAGEPYADKLLPLPRFLTDKGRGVPNAGDLADGFRLTGYFLDRHIFGPRGIAMPVSREKLRLAVAAD